MIVALDPGGKSGVAIRYNNGEIVTLICESLFNKPKVTFDPAELYGLIAPLDSSDHIVIETFQAQTIDKYGLHTVRLVGGVEAICFIKNIPLTKHMPQRRRPFLQEAIDFLDARKQKYMTHERDALAHLFRYEYDVEQEKK